MNKLIYLASPYSSSNAYTRERRFNEICFIAGQLMLEGHAIYCPIAESHSIQRLHVDAMSGGWDFWKGQDLPKLDRCDELWVVQLDGWDTSTGVKGEVEYMREQGKPIKFINPNTYLNRGD